MRAVIFDWFWDALRDAIELMLELIVANTIYELDNSLLWSPLNTAMPVVYDFVITIIANVTGPIGLTLVSMFLILELIGRLTKDYDSQTGVGTLHMVLVVAIKLMAFKLIIDFAPMLLRLIYEYARSIILGIRSTTFDAGEVSLLAGSAADIPNGGGLFVVLIILIVALLVSSLLPIIVTILVALRFFELYIYMAFAPISLATLANEETRRVGDGFIKSFAGVALQGAILLLVVFIYPMILASLLPESPQGSYAQAQEVIVFALGVLGYCIAAIIMLFASSRLAAKITGG